MSAVITVSFWLIVKEQRIRVVDLLVMQCLGVEA